ncbi:MAG: c-type cytochrome [Betaproteobacteria bacterium]|nr:c-type cytochrome [Betaproteobacteria bacterium]
MSDDHIKMSKTTPMQVVSAVLGGLLPPLIAIILIVVLVIKIQMSHSSAAPLNMDPKVVDARIKPVGDLVVADLSKVHVDMTGEQVFNAVCTACHTPGALGAPIFGNKALWAPRIKQGYQTLISHAENGIRSMPARGGNPDLSDLEIARAVAYMANAGGANFTPPAAPSAPAATATPAAK